jgi:hypothetical protein
MVDVSLWGRQRMWEHGGSELVGAEDMAAWRKWENSGCELGGRPTMWERGGCALLHA